MCCFCFEALVSCEQKPVLILIDGSRWRNGGFVSAKHWRAENGAHSCKFARNEYSTWQTLQQCTPKPASQWFADSRTAIRARVSAGKQVQGG